LNRDLVEWECGFVDCWDSQGHYTKDTEPAPHVWGLALDLADAAVAAGECLTLDINSEDDQELVAGLFLTALSIYVDYTDVKFADAFDDDEELHDWLESMVNTAYDAKEREWSLTKIHSIIADNLPRFFE